MAITKSILEDFELSTGTQVTVQGSQTDRIVLSIDDSDSNHSFYMKADEALKLAELLNKVVEEQRQ